MRRVVTGGDLSQRAMRPPDLLNAYLALVDDDIHRLGLLDGARDERPCPADLADAAEQPDRSMNARRRCEFDGHRTANDKTRRP